MTPEEKISAKIIKAHRPTPTELKNIYHGKTITSRFLEELGKYYEHRYEEKLSAEYNKGYNKGYASGYKNGKKDAGERYSKKMIADELGIGYSTLCRDVKKMRFGSAIKRQLLAKIIEQVSKVKYLEELG